MLRHSVLLSCLLAVACGAPSATGPGARRGEWSRREAPRDGKAAPPGSASAKPAGSAPPVAPTPSAPPAPPPGPLAEVEDAVPLSVERVGYGGRWLAVCTARADSDKNGRLAVEIGPQGTLLGDTLALELAVGGRTAVPIDDLLAFDPTGRWLVVRRGGKPLLMAVDSERELDLTTLEWDDRDDAVPLRGHRALAFDPRGELLAYVRRHAGRSDVIVRELASGAERAVADLPGEPYRMTWDGTGETLVVSSVADDTNQNGRLDWPAPGAKGPRLRCAGPLPRFRVTPEIGDRPSTFVVPRAKAVARFVPEFAAAFGANVIVRASDGELLLEGPGGRKALTSAACLARILHSDPARGLLVVACPEKNPQRATVELVGVGYRLELGVEVQPTAIDAWPGEAQRLVAIYPGSDALLVDMDKRTTVHLESGDQVIAIEGPRVLLRRSGAIVLLDVDQNTTKTLVQKLPPLPQVLVEGTMAVVGASLLDVRHDDPVGSVAGRALGLTAWGDVLFARGGPPSAEKLAMGPLRWQAPMPGAGPVVLR